MYNFAGLREAHAAMWSAIAARMHARGFAGVPDSLDFTASPVPERIGAEVLFTQTCGYPLQKRYGGQWEILASPDYDAPGCGAETHCAFVVVHADDPRASIADLRGARFAVNSFASNSGMNLPRSLFAPLAREGRFFGEVLTSGSHPASLAMVREGAADAAAVDCLTWQYAGEHDAPLISGLRVLDSTPPSPTIPFVSSKHVEPAVREALRDSLIWFGSDPDWTDIRKALHLRRINEADPARYRYIIGLEDQAARQGYSVLS